MWTPDLISVGLPGLIDATSNMGLVCATTKQAAASITAMKPMTHLISCTPEYVKTSAREKSYMAGFLIRTRTVFRRRRGKAWVTEPTSRILQLVSLNPSQRLSGCEHRQRIPFANISELRGSIVGQ